MRMTWATRATVAAVCLSGALAFAGAALAGPEEDLAARYAPVVRLVDAAGGVRPGGAVHPDRRRRAVRGADRRASRPLESHRPRQDRSGRHRSRQPLRVPPRLPGRPARCRLRLRALVASPDEDLAADGVRPCRNGPRLSRPARAAVLVLLSLQRLQQHPRGRLGDDAARLRRRRRDRGADEGAEQGRLQLARGCRGRRMGRREARARRRDASRRLSGGRLAREQVHRGALPWQLGGRRRRLRRHRRAASRADSDREDDPERSGGGGGRRSRGSRSRAAGASSRRRSSTGRPGPT